MRIPPQPPDLAKIRLALTEDPRRFVDLITSLPMTVAMPEYLPWDKIRFKEPPEGLSREEWWFQLKTSRSMMLRPLPFKDKTGAGFQYALPDTVLKMLDDISRRASGQIAISEQVTNPSTRDRYIVSSLMEEAITSSQLEGADTARKVAKEMIRSGRPPRNKGEKMILNNYDAMRHIRDLGTRDLTPELVCEIHAIVTQGTLDDPAHAGRIQSDPDPGARVAVYGHDDQLIHTPPPVDQLKSRLDALCEFANGSKDDTYVHPVLRALTVHFMMGYDHYFEDGNGRTARILFYWVMLREKYWLTEFLTISKILKAAPSQYTRSFIYSEQDDGDLTYFFIYHLGIIRRAIDELDKYLARKVGELRETRLLLSATPGEYNHRQLAILELAMKDNSAYFSVSTHATSHNVSEETARQDLGDLAHRELLLRTKEGKRFVWRPVAHLSDRIRSNPTKGAFRASGDTARPAGGL